MMFISAETSGFTSMFGERKLGGGVECCFHAASLRLSSASVFWRSYLKHVPEAHRNSGGVCFQS